MRRHASLRCLLRRLRFAYSALRCGTGWEAATLLARIARCQVLRSAETFQRARSKLKKAENTDDIATSTDQEKGRGKRKRFAVFTSDDSDSDEPSCALPPPFRLRSCSNDGPSQRNTLPSSPSTFEQSAARVQIPAPEQSEVPAQPAVAEQPVPSTEEQDIHSAPPLDEQIDAVEVKLRSNKVFHEKLVNFSMFLRLFPP
ncbi:hypothetical protein V5799_005490 [Amblyomma americanum]|uniref:Uncharacterized protein n=1 Tax=Amblyomma americanum TaxID=6943 RepID=A0AAQ4DZ42_AMBAM